MTQQDREHDVNWFLEGFKESQIREWKAAGYTLDQAIVTREETGRSDPRDLPAAEEERFNAWQKLGFLANEARELVQYKVPLDNPALLEIAKQRRDQERVLRNQGFTDSDIIDYRTEQYMNVDSMSEYIEEFYEAEGYVQTTDVTF